MSRLLQISVRPFQSAGAPAGTSVEITWLGTMSAIRSNHHSDSWVRTRPLSGISFGSTQSWADIRSLATMTSSPDPVR